MLGLQLARQVACGLREVVVELVSAEVEFWADTDAAKAKVATAAKKRIFAMKKVDERPIKECQNED